MTLGVPQQKYHEISNIRLDIFGWGLPGFFLSTGIFLWGDSPLHLSSALKSDPVLELFNRVLAVEGQIKHRGYDRVPGMEHTQVTTGM